MLLREIYQIRPKNCKTVANTGDLSCIFADWAGFI